MVHIPSLRITEAMVRGAHEEGVPSKHERNSSSRNQDKKETEINVEKVPVSAPPNKPPPPKKESFCKFCNKKFSNSQALGGHQNGHREEREAAKRQKILSLASAYKNSPDYFSFGNSNQAYYGLGGKTIGVQPLSMTHNSSLYDWPHVGLKQDSHSYLWQGDQTLNHLQPTMNQLQPLMSERRGIFDQCYKSDSSAFRGGPQNSGSQPPLLNPRFCFDGTFGQASNSSIKPQDDATIEWPDLTVKSLFDSGDFGQAKKSSKRPHDAITEMPDLNVKSLCDNENSSQGNRFSMSENGTPEIDLNLKL